MGDSPWGPRGAPEDHGWGKGLHWSEGIKKKKPKIHLFQKTGPFPRIWLCRSGDRFTCPQRCQGARRAGLSGARRRRPRPRAASGRPSPRLSPRAAPPAAPGSASPATTTGPGGDGGAPGAAAPGWGGAPLSLLTRGTGGRPPSSSAGSRSAP